MLSNNWLKALRNRLASVSGTSLRRRRGKTGTKVQSLEQRALLAAAPVGPEFRVNTYTTASQQTPSSPPSGVAMDDAGNYVIAWTSDGIDGQNGQDGSRGGVYAQRYNAAGVPQGSEFRVNTYTQDWQDRPAVAMDSDGDFVITWASWQDGHGFGIYGQRYSAAGVSLGAEFQINTETWQNQADNSIAMDDDGDFVVTWGSHAQDGSGGGIFAQRYNAAGVPQGTEFRVNTYTTSDQRLSSVAMDADGDFVVSWLSDGQDGDGSGIYAQRFNSNGIAQGTEFLVNSHTALGQYAPQVAMDSSGAFVVTWNSNEQDGFWDGVYAQRYNASGVAQGSEFRVNTYTFFAQSSARVAMEADGDFVIAWHSNQDGGGYGVYGQRYNASGAAQGSEFRINSYTTSTQYQPSIAVDPDGDFVVAWNSDGQDGSSFGVYGQRFDGAATGVVLTVVSPLLSSTPQVSVTVTDSFGGSGIAANAAVLIDVDRNNDGDYADASELEVASGTAASGTATITLPSLPDGLYKLRARANDIAGNQGISSQTTLTVNPSAPVVTSVLAANDPVTSNERLISGTQSLTVVFSENMASSGASSVTSLANWQLTKNGANADSQLQSVTFGFNAATNRHEAVVNFAAALTSGDYVLTAKDTLTDVVGRQLDGDANGTDGGNFTRSFSVKQIGGSGPEFRANTYTTGNQRTFAESTQSVAMDDAGNYVITWNSNGQDGAGYGIYAQRYTAAGVPLGAEFRVNTTTALTQFLPSVAMDADGDFLITWTSSTQDGSGYGVYAQRYNSAGLAQGIEFRVNTHITGHQQFSTVAMDADGDFVISWSSYGQDGNLDGVYARRYNAAGVAQGLEFKVNTYTTSSQSRSTVAIDADGDFVIAWQSNSQDASGSGVYAQRYNAAGVAQGAEFKVNTYTAFGQAGASVAMGADGEFVIAWGSNGQDGSDYGIYAQRFSALGVAQGNEFRVNSYTTGVQQYPSVSIDADGDFVVTWTSDGQDGANLGIYAQRYNRMGVPEGYEFRVSTYTTVSQRFASVSMDSDGDFVVAWNSGNQDGSGYGMYTQRFGTNATTVLEVTSLGDTVTTNEQLVSVPQSLTVAFSNAMSTTGTGSATNLANWGLTRNGVDSSSLLQSVTFGFSATTNRYEAVVNFTTGLTPGDYVLTANGTMVNGNGFVLDGDANGTDGGDFSRGFGVRVPGPTGLEHRVNSFTANNQGSFTGVPRSVAMDQNGNYVVTWDSSGQDGSNLGVMLNASMLRD